MPSRFLAGEDSFLGTLAPKSTEAQLRSGEISVRAHALPHPPRLSSDPVRPLSPADGGSAVGMAGRQRLQEWKKGSSKLQVLRNCF